MSYADDEDTCTCETDYIEWHECPLDMALRGESPGCHCCEACTEDCERSI